MMWDTGIVSKTILMNQTSFRHLSNPEGLKMKTPSASCRMGVTTTESMLTNVLLFGRDCFVDAQAMPESLRQEYHDLVETFETTTLAGEAATKDVFDDRAEIELTRLQDRLHPLRALESHVQAFWAKPPSEKLRESAIL
eukprot:298401-Amphidinium_carterae.3